MSPPVKATVAGLIVASVGIVIQIFAGVDFPAIPPGLVILLLAAGAVAFAPWRWTLVVATLVGLSQLVGLFLAGQAGRLVDLTQPVGLVGLWVQLLALATAVMASVIALPQKHERHSS